MTNEFALARASLCTNSNSSSSESVRGEVFFFFFWNGARARYATANKQTSKLMFVICRNELIFEYASKCTWYKHTNYAEQTLLLCVNDVMRTTYAAWQWSWRVEGQYLFSFFLLLIPFLRDIRTEHCQIIPIKMQLRNFSLPVFISHFHFLSSAVRWNYLATTKLKYIILFIIGFSE